MLPPDIPAQHLQKKKTDMSDKIIAKLFHPVAGGKNIEALE